MSVKTMDSRRTSSFTRLLIFYFLSVTLASIAFTIQDSLTLGQAAPFHDSFIPFGYPYIYPSLLATLLSVWIMTHFIDRRPFVSVGLQAGWPIIYYGCGSFLAGVLYKTTLIYAILIFQGGHYPAWPFLAIPHETSQLVTEALRFLAAAVYEELFFRGYLLQTLLSGVGQLPAVLLSSIAFGIVHTGYNSWMYLVNAGLLGVLLSIIYLRTHSLWISIGLHFGFNLIGGSWGIVSKGSALTKAPSHILSLDNPIYTLGTGIMILLALLLPLRPHPRMKALWEEYIHPAPFPPWRKPAHASQENSKSQPPMDLSAQHPGRDRDSADA